MRKVKFTQDSFDEKLGAILEEFPIIDVSPSFFGGYGRAEGIAERGRVPASVYMRPHHSFCRTLAIFGAYSHLPSSLCAI